MNPSSLFPLPFFRQLRTSRRAITGAAQLLERLSKLPTDVLAPVDQRRRWGADDPCCDFVRVCPRECASEHRIADNPVSQTGVVEALDRNTVCRRGHGQRLPRIEESVFGILEHRDVKSRRSIRQARR